MVCAQIFQNPPRHPGIPPVEDGDGTTAKKILSWRKKANRFARYYLVLFRPEERLYNNTQTNLYSYNWEAFVEYTTWLRDKNRWYETNYLELIIKYATGWNTNQKNRSIISSYRARNSIIWTKKEHSEAKAEFGRFTMHHNDDDNEADEIDLRFLNLSTGRELQIMRTVSYTDDMVNALDKAMGEETHGRRSTDNLETNDTKKGKNHWRTSHFSRQVRIVPPETRLAEDLTQDISFEESDEDDGEDPGNESTWRWGDHTTMHNKVASYMESSNLSQDQELAIQPMKQHYQHLNDGVEGNYSSPVLLVTGGPGTGKSYLVDVLDGVSKIMSVGEQIRMAFLGIAAVNIDGVTLIKLLDIPIQRKKGKQRVRGWNIKNWNHSKICLTLVIYRP